LKTIRELPKLGNTKNYLWNYIGVV
jgi:hypothetical protein